MNALAHKRRSDSSSTEKLPAFTCSLYDLISPQPSLISPVDLKTAHQFPEFGVFVSI
jgi:hypothetical protein